VVFNAHNIIDRPEQIFSQRPARVTGNWLSKDISRQLLTLW